jgi:predicted nucleic acid-binding protein
LQRNLDGWVIDSSVVLKWYLRDGDLLAQADAMLATVSDNSIVTTAPYLSRYEVARAIVNASRRGRITWEEGQAMIDSFIVSPLPIAADQDWLIVRASHRAVQTGIALYDSVYLSLAEALQFQYVTADLKLYNRINDVPFVHWLADI